MYTPYTSLLYSHENLGLQGYTSFSYFALKHRLWVLVRTASINVLSKNKKNITIFNLNIIFFTAVKNCSILHGHVFVMFFGGHVINRPTLWLPVSSADIITFANSLDTGQARRMIRVQARQIVGLIRVQTV